MTVLDVLEGRSPYALHHGDCLAWLDTLPDACVDAVVCDPPYAEIDRDYGRMTEAEWEVFAHALVRKSLRVLKPRGSAVFIVQPNSERVGRMRAWVFRFLAWCADDLVRETGGRVGMVQDAWWWNENAMPTVHCHRDVGLMRPSLKACAWIGPEDCCRAQDEVLTPVKASAREALRTDTFRNPCGATSNPGRAVRTAQERGGATPLNVLSVMPDGDAGRVGHGAGTPYDLAAWWVRYLCPKGGVVADPCGGTFTMGLAAVRQGRRFLGCEKERHHFDAGVRRMSACDLDTASPLRVARTDDGPLFGVTPR